MGFASFEGLRSRVELAWVLSSALALVGATGCGVQELPPEDEASALQTRSQELQMDNGLSLNGLSLNGLSLNGLSLNGLATTDFSSWFNGSPENNDRLMRYMVRCAVPAGETRTFTNPSTGAVYTWWGVLGLAPNWAGGAPATPEEQQIISACLGAHANNYGLHVSISVLGRDSKGVAIPFSSEELATFSKKESCFFGNIFTDEGLFAGNDRNSLAADESTSRPCGLKAYKASSNAECSQVKRIGQCEDFCSLDASGTFYTSCSYNGMQYKPLTTRLRPQDVHRCGDGVCQRGESPGWGVTADSCLLDCGSP